MNVIGNYTRSSAASSHSGRGFDQGPICPHVQPTPLQQHCSHSHPLDGTLSGPRWMLSTEGRPVRLRVHRCHPAPITQGAALLQQYFPLALRMCRRAANPSPTLHCCPRRARSECHSRCSWGPHEHAQSASMPSGVRGHRGCSRQGCSSIAMRKRCSPESITPDPRRRRAWGLRSGIASV
ncbi:uncharacterized protein SCHCODRAFT_02620305, partial [Schizophyllum commune H4-8]